MSQSARTKAKIRENLALVIKYLEGRYGSVDEATEQVIFNALDWTADDVERQLVGEQ